MSFHKVSDRLVLSVLCVLCVAACPLEVDAVYGLQWGFADAGQTVVQPCGPEFIGQLGG